MKEIHSQLRKAQDCPPFELVFLPYTDEDKELARGYRVNQIVKQKTSGTRKERSLKQLRLYWACCELVAGMTSANESIFDKDDIDFEIKIQVAKKKPAMIRRFKSVDGIVYMEPISIAMKNMPHLIACKFFEAAYQSMADLVGMTPEALIALAKSKMG